MTNLVDTTPSTVDDIVAGLVLGALVGVVVALAVAVVSRSTGRSELMALVPLCRRASSRTVAAIAAAACLTLVVTVVGLVATPSILIIPAIVGGVTLISGGVRSKSGWSIACQTAAVTAATAAGWVRSVSALDVGGSGPTGTVVAAATIALLVALGRAERNGGPPLSALIRSRVPHGNQTVRRLKRQVDRWVDRAALDTADLAWWAADVRRDGETILITVPGSGGRLNAVVTNTASSSVVLLTPAGRVKGTAALLRI